MPEATVLVRRGALGDVVLLGAVTSSLPGPVIVVTDRRYVALVRRMRGVTRVVPWGAGRPVGRVVDLQRDLGSLWRYPMATRARKHSLRRRLRLWGWGHGRPPVASLYARACQVPAAAPPWFDLAEQRRDTLVVLPGASSALKAPRVDQLRTLAEGWDGPVVALGGPGELALVQASIRGLRNARALAEDGFDQTLDVFARTRVAIGGDSGLLHLAAASGARVVAMAGPTHPDDGFLRWPTGQVVQRDLACRPCTLHRGAHCRVGGRPCMDHDGDALRRAVERSCTG